jgi:hypothetical protein
LPVIALKRNKTSLVALGRNDIGPPLTGGPAPTGVPLVVALGRNDIGPPLTGGAAPTGVPLVVALGRNYPEIRNPEVAIDARAKSNDSPRSRRRFRCASRRARP